MLEGLEPVLSFHHVFEFRQLVVRWQPTKRRRCEAKKLGNQRAGETVAIISGSTPLIILLDLTALL